ncbi:CAP domain-containing protein, partial [Melampsora americana]
SAALPAAIPAPLSAPKVAPNPNPTLSAQPQTISAQPPKAHPQAPHPVMNLHPSLPTYGQEASLGSDIDRWVKGHNKVRKMYTVADVTWNPQLALAAARQADTCYFKHTPQNRYGENIAAGQQSIEQVMNEWVFGPGERDSYVRTDPTSHSHYTQVVWADTKQIGCAVKTCNQFGGAALGPGPVKFWVCEYDPPGNVLGWSAKKVHAATGGAPLSAYAANYKHRRGHRFSSSKH